MSWVVGMFMFILIFLLNLKSNLLLTSVLRASVAFLFFFSLSWLLKWMYTNFSQEKNHNSSTTLGKTIELQTTKEEDQMLFEEMYHQEDERSTSTQGDFQPLEFEKLSTDKK